MLMASLARKALKSKWLITGTVAVLIAVLGVGFWGYKKATSSTKSYCAQMTDAVGMFNGNAVTRRGVKVGTVTSVTPKGNMAIIKFTVDSKQKLPADVGAVTVSPSILAVRQLALMGDYHGGPTLSEGQCIKLANTKTPVSIAQSLESVSKLSDQLTTGGGPQQLGQVLASMGTVNNELAGTGPIINAIIKQLAVQPNTPINGAMGDIGTLIDNLAGLTTGMAANWGTGKQLVESVVNGQGWIQPSLKYLLSIVQSVQPIISVLGSLIERYGHFVFPAVDAIVPMARVIGAGFRSFGDVLGIVPPLVRAFTVNFDQNTFGLSIKYTPPSTHIPAKNPVQTCANINRYFPGQCTVVDPQTMDVQIIRLALEMTGGKP